MTDNANPKPLSPVLTQPLTTDAPLYVDLSKDFQRLKGQKSRATGGIEARVLINLGFVSGEHYLFYKNRQISTEPQDANKLYLQFDLIGPRLDKVIGRLAAMNGIYKAAPSKDDPQAYEDAEVVDQLIAALDEKLGQVNITWKVLWWMAVAGTAFEYVWWCPNDTIEPMPQTNEDGEPLFTFSPDGSQVTEAQMTEAVQSGQAFPEQFELFEEVDTVGDVASEVFGPLNVFIDQSTASVKAMAPDQWIHLARIKTVGWIKDNFDVEIEPSKEFNIVTTQFKVTPDASSTGGIFLRDLIPMVQGAADENDPPMVTFVESYQPASKSYPHGRYVAWVVDRGLLNGPEGEDNPYPEVPFVDFHWKPTTTSFWTKDYVTPLIAPQRFLNKRVSQLGEQANATLYSSLLLGPGMDASDIPADFPGVIKNGLSENGAPQIGRLEPPQLPAWFMESIKLTVQMFNDIAGGNDLFSSSGSSGMGQMRGPMAVPMMQEILDTEWGPLYEHLGDRFSLVKQMRLNIVKEYYPPARTLHYTSKEQKDEVLQFHTEKVLRSGTNFNIRVERGSLVPELRALREARLRERLSSPLAILYMDERTGQLDKSKIAADLKFGDAGREGREAQYRKLGSEIVAMLWKGQPVPPVLPFYNHPAMMDELEHAMATTEFLKASPQVQQLFNARWEEHRQFLMQAAQQQQAMMQQQQSQSAVAQATQQAAAQAAAEAVHSANDQMDAQRAQPTEDLVRSAAERNSVQDRTKPKREMSFKLKEH